MGFSDPEFVIPMVILAALFGYIGLSLIFLKNPLLLHKKKKPKFKCVHISHRGGAAEHLENTMAAFKHAVMVGTDMLETDCQITRDGEVVVCHDNNLKRTTGQKQLISDTYYKDLPLMKESLKLDFDPSYKTDPHSDRQIVLLRDVFEAFPTVPINIDIKENSDDLIKKVLELMAAYKREDITVVGNVNEVVVQKARELNPSVLTCCSKSRVLRLYLYFYLGLLPFVPIEETFLEILMPRIILNKFGVSADHGRMYVLLVKVIDWLLMSRVLFNHLNKRGIQTYLWVLNDEEDWERAFQLGATGVMTDFPTKLAQFLDAHPELRGAG